jgi:hypothetical protein
VMKRTIYLFLLPAWTRITALLPTVMGMQNTTHTKKNKKTNNCASCGKTFNKNEMKVSYDFERFYCFRCDDNK